MQTTAHIWSVVLLLFSTSILHPEEPDTSTPQVPELVNLVLASTSGRNLDTDDLICNYDLAGAATTAATA